MPEQSPLERTFETRWIQLGQGYPEPVPEHRFSAERKFKFDFAWPEFKVAVEVEGGTRTGGRHVRGDGYEKDCEKYNLAALMGWLVLRYTSTMLTRDPSAMVDQIKWALERRIQTMSAAVQTIIGLEMDTERAQFVVSEIQRRLDNADQQLSIARQLIWELKQYEGWKALGYKSWNACVQTEFEQSSASVYRQLNAALVELELSPVGEIGQINERVLRPLTRRNFDAEARQAIWAISQEIVGEGGKVTTGVVEAVTEGFKEMLASGAAQDGNGDQHALTEVMHADLVARVREVKLAHKAHVQRMDKPRDYIVGGRKTDGVTRATLNGRSKAAVMIELESSAEVEKLSDALRKGRTIYCSLWTEE